MEVTVAATGDARTVLDTAGAHLRSEPVLHNLVLTLLHARAATGEPGRYWTAAVDGQVCGVAFQSPPHFPALVTTVPGDVAAALAAALAAAVAADGVHVPGVKGEASTAARFAGAWTEHRGTGAVPVGGLRIYELHRVEAPVGVAGRCRLAEGADRALLVDWLHAFHAEVGDTPDRDPAAVVDERLEQGRFWVWDNGGIVSMATCTPALAGVARVHAVYTPPDHRASGYAAACVASLSGELLHEDLRPILFTDLGNPVSNRVYRRIGYRAVAECVGYRFTG